MPERPVASRQVLLLAAHVVAVLVGATVLTVFAHDVPYLLSRGYWQDENWVALIGRYPLSDLPALTSSTPIGWDLLQRSLLPFGPQAPRLLALSFAVLASAAAYFLGYVAWSGSWLRRAATGIVVAFAVTFSASLLVRNDLKQYTADAFVALLIVALLAIAGRSQTRAPLVALTIVSATGLFFSLTTAFVAASAFLALILAAVVAKNWRRVRTLVIFGAIAGAGILIEYVGFYLRASGNPKLTAYWVDYFPTASGLFGRIATGYGQFFRIHGPGAGIITTAVVVALIALFIVFAVRSRQLAVAIYYPIVFVLLCVLGLVHFYPLFNDRTSTFFAVTTVALAAAGLVRAGFAIVGNVRSRPVRLALAAIGIVALIAVAVLPNRQWIRSHMVPFESGSEQVAYIKSHFAPGDVIVTNEFGAVALAFYWPELGYGWEPTPNRPYGWDVVFNDKQEVVRADQIDGGLPVILDEEAATGTSHTVWILQTHNVIPGIDAAQDAYTFETVPFEPSPADRIVYPTVDEALRYLTIEVAP